MDAGSMATQLVLFEYGDLPAKDTRHCEQAAERIRKRQRSIAKDVIAMGQELLDVKERLPHGMFGKWLEFHFGWSERTSRNMMQAAVVFKTANFAELTIDQSALYLLSSESCPEDATELAIERAQKGERITHKLAKQIIAECENSQDECDDEEDDAFDVDAEGDKLRDWLRKTLKRWPQESRHEAIHWIKQIIEKECLL